MTVIPLFDMPHFTLKAHLKTARRFVELVDADKHKLVLQNNGDDLLINTITKELISTGCDVTREQVIELIEHLQAWLDKGEF